MSWLSWYFLGLLLGMALCWLLYWPLAHYALRPEYHTRRFTQRGFEEFCRLVDTRGTEVVVRESSQIGEPCVWIFANKLPRDPGAMGDGPAPHLPRTNQTEPVDFCERH